MEPSPTWEEDKKKGLVPGGLSKDPNVIVETLPTKDGLHGRGAAALVAALSVLFEEDYGKVQDWASMLAVMGRLKNRPKSKDELRQLGGLGNGHEETKN